jgi:hypothetical protein
MASATIGAAARCEDIFSLVHSAPGNARIARMPCVVTSTWGAQAARAQGLRDASGSHAVASTSIRMSAVGNMALTSTTVEAGGSPVKNSLRTRL